MNVWFPSKYSSASALVLKQYILLVLSNGPINESLDVNTSEASKGENVYCNVDKVYLSYEFDYLEPSIVIFCTSIW